MSALARLVCLALGTAFATTSLASGSGQVIAQLLDVPPETKVKMLRVILEDLFGTPEELKARFAAACDARQKPPGGTAKAVAPSSENTAASARSYSREATLAAFCLPQARRGIESFLSFKPASPDAPPGSGAAAPNPSGDKAASSKPLAAPHAKP